MTSNDFFKILDETNGLVIKRTFLVRKIIVEFFLEMEYY